MGEVIGPLSEGGTRGRKDLAALVWALERKVNTVSKTHKGGLEAISPPPPLLLRPRAALHHSSLNTGA